MNKLILLIGVMVSFNLFAQDVEVAEDPLELSQEEIEYNWCLATEILKRINATKVCVGMVGNKFNEQEAGRSFKSKEDAPGCFEALKKDIVSLPDYCSYPKEDHTN